MLLLLFLVLGIRVSWGQGGRHTGVARVRAVHGDKNILSVTSVGLCGFLTVTWMSCGRGCAILVSYKPLVIKVPTSAVDAVRRCCAATRVSTRLRSAEATAEHSYTSLRGRRVPLRHRALEQIYKLTSSRLAS